MSVSVETAFSCLCWWRQPRPGELQDPEWPQRLVLPVGSSSSTDPRGGDGAESLERGMVWLVRGAPFAPDGSEHPHSQAPRGCSTCVGDSPGILAGDAPPPQNGPACAGGAAGSGQGLSSNMSLCQRVWLQEEPLVWLLVPISWVAVSDEGGKGLTAPGFAPVPSQGPFGSEPGALRHLPRVNPAWAIQTPPAEVSTRLVCSGK